MAVDGAQRVAQAVRARSDDARRVAQAVRARSDEAGQGVVEYGLILVGSALFALVMLVFFNGTLSAVLEVIGEAIERAS